MLNFGGYGAFGFFNSATSQNYQNFGFNTDGRLDIYRDWNVTASAAFTGTTELLGTPDVAQTLSPSVVYALPITVGMFQRFSRLFYQVNAGYTALRYSDFSQLNTNALPAGSRDRTSSPSHCGPAMNFAKASMSGCRAGSINAATCSK
jgi:Uncharacterized protein conserved in bacteria (DUF2320).